MSIQSRLAKLEKAKADNETPSICLFVVSHDMEGNEELISIGMSNSKLPELKNLDNIPLDEFLKMADEHFGEDVTGRYYKENKLELV